ncbi:MAG: hypothetical protein DRN92_03590 [Thermoproteota archaeon]|nr:MAG: hypothetical protein DRN92_03590 [Candidatus Korarchaeota archaeon]
MELLFVGTGVGVPNRERIGSSLYIKINHISLLIDLAPGVLRRLEELNIRYQDIDYFLITHFHVDHILELPLLLFVAKYPLDPRQKAWQFCGPRGIDKLFDRLLYAYGKQIAPDVPINFIEMPPNTLYLPGYVVTAFRTVHTRESHGYKIEGRGKKIVYSGDTEFSISLIEVSESADILILEASFPFDTTGHMTPERAAELAREAHVKRLILTHMYPLKFDLAIERAKEIFPDIEVAYDGLKIIL